LTLLSESLPIYYCPHCGYIWEGIIVCPKCKKQVDQEHRLDTPLPDLSPYSGAVFLGADTGEGAIYYFDPLYNVVLEFYGEPPNIFDRVVEYKGRPEDLKENLENALNANEWTYNRIEEALKRIEP